MSKEISDRVDTKADAPPDCSGAFVDEAYQIMFQQYGASPEAQPINTSETVRQGINRTWQLAEPLLRTANDFVQRAEAALEGDTVNSPWKNVDLKAADRAYEAFPELQENGIPKSLIAGIILNEALHSGDVTDPLEDLSVNIFGTVRHWDSRENTSASIGPAQMQIGNIRHLANEHPQLNHFGDPVRAAMDADKAPFFVAAYISDQIHTLHNHGIDPTPEAIAYTYNHDVYRRPDADPNNLRLEDYESVTAADKIDGKLLGSTPHLAGWHSEVYPRNNFIIQKSTVVKDIMASVHDIEQAEKTYL